MHSAELFKALGDLVITFFLDSYFKPVKYEFITLQPKTGRAV